MLNYKMIKSYVLHHQLNTDGDYNLFLIVGQVLDAGSYQNINIGTIGLTGDLQRQLLKLYENIDFNFFIKEIITTKPHYIDLILNGKFFREDSEYLFYPGENYSNSTLLLSWGKYPKLIFTEKLVDRI